jgi:hypothetical protein
MALFLIGVTLATCALAAADSAGGALATGEALAKAAAPSGARVVELALDSLVATSYPLAIQFSQAKLRREDPATNQVSPVHLKHDKPPFSS